MNLGPQIVRHYFRTQSRFKPSGGRNPGFEVPADRYGNPIPRAERADNTTILVDEPAREQPRWNGQHVYVTKLDRETRFASIATVEVISRLEYRR